LLDLKLFLADYLPLSLSRTQVNLAFKKVKQTKHRAGLVCLAATLIVRRFYLFPYGASIGIKAFSGK
jgi:hypothetical protein